MKRQKTQPSNVRTFPLTVGELLTVGDALAVVYRSGPPGLVSYRIAVLKSRLNPELEEAVKQRFALYKKYWPENAAGECIPDQKDEKFAEFQKQLGLLFEPKVVLRISASDLLPLSFLQYVPSLMPLHTEALMRFLETEKKEDSQ